MRVGLRAEAHAEKTIEYASYREALQHFLSMTNIKEADVYFPDWRQAALPLDADKPAI
jgi:hypothetical protein